MKIVVDVNIILSALLKNSATRKIIFKSNSNFYFPELSLNKVKKYEREVILRSKLSKEEYLEVLTELFKYIKIVPVEQILVEWNHAKRIMEKIDEEDVIFIATALTLEDSIIWSDDRDFEKQDTVRVIKTKDLLKYFDLFK